MAHRTEAEIELTVEKLTDEMDTRLMSGVLSQAEYDSGMRSLNEWAENEYRRILRAEQES